MEEIVEELPEGADLSTDPGHMEDLLSDTTEAPSPIDSTPSPPPPPMNSDLGPNPVVIDEDQNPPSASSATSSAPPQSSDHESEGTQEGEGGGGGGGKKEEHKYATLSRVRKFKVDGQVMQSTTRKIVDVTANKTLRDNKKYQQMR